MLTSEAPPTSSPLNLPGVPGAKEDAPKPTKWPHWKSQEAIDQRTKALSDQHPCRECGKPATRVFKYFYYYCEKHWPIGGMIMATRKAFYQRTVGTLVAKEQERLIREEKQHLNTARFEASRRRMRKRRP